MEQKKITMAINELKKMPTSFTLEEERRQEKLEEEFKQQVIKEKEKKSILNRIKEGAFKTDKSQVIKAHDPVEIVERFKKHRRNYLKEKGLDSGDLTSSRGRKTLLEKDKKEKITISLSKDHLEIINKKCGKQSYKRSSEIAKCIDRDQKIYEMRKKQSDIIRSFLKSYEELLSKLDIENIDSIRWRDSVIPYQSNEKILIDLYRVSKEIQNFIEIACIEVKGKNSSILAGELEFSELAPFLDNKELKVLSFALNPQNIAKVIKDDTHEIE